MLLCNKKSTNLKMIISVGGNKKVFVTVFGIILQKKPIKV